MYSIYIISTQYTVKTITDYIKYYFLFINTTSSFYIKDQPTGKVPNFRLGIYPINSN